MATMFHSDNEEFKTEGERRFYRFLKVVAKPDSHYLAWYLPDIDEKISDYCCSDYLQKVTKSVIFCKQYIQ